ncbi:hypothetical protein [Neptunomonas japonica]|uniref:hypothetical protein n=1 Tax=Neptunomonas japonica TaxID=417574 RepID=UPI0012EC6C65|nr:hypothetical protein [Neptunomonas japonica]
MIETKLYQQHFPGFTFASHSDSSQPELSNYEYQPLDNEKLVVTRCKQASDFDISKIPDYDYFRFKLLLVSCKATDKYLKASNAHSTNFPAKLDVELISRFPAEVTPLLSKADLLDKQGMTYKIYDASTHITREKNNTFKLLTKEDEVYLTLLARGDFTNDGFEDLLIQSEWHARNAHGKHVDLLILSKLDKDGEIDIIWRLNNLHGS